VNSLMPVYDGSNNRLTNTLPYYTIILISIVKSFIRFVQGTDK